MGGILSGVCMSRKLKRQTLYSCDHGFGKVADCLEYGPGPFRENQLLARESVGSLGVRHGEQTGQTTRKFFVTAGTSEIGHHCQGRDKLPERGEIDKKAD